MQSQKFVKVMGRVDVEEGLKKLTKEDIDELVEFGEFSRKEAKRLRAVGALVCQCCGDVYVPIDSIKK
jgi:hypothetical protein